MVIFFQRLRLIAAAALAMAFLCQCQTQRTYGEIRRGSTTFDEADWGGQGGGSDEKEIRSKFAERGYSISEEGSIVANKPDLYSNKTAKESGSKVGKKQARLGNREAETKAFKTPEYLKRQEYAGVSEAREGGSNAREGDFDGTRDNQAGKLFKTKKAKSTGNQNSYTTNEYSPANRTFDTGQDRRGNAAYQGAADAQGTPFKSGYQDNTKISLDDVKQMLNPGAYAKAKGL
tara:strand:+ start:2445 stop:3140 length:696 start_codon:yes stop_codon:yes gene_type:complete